MRLGVALWCVLLFTALWCSWCYAATGIAAALTVIVALELLAGVALVSGRVR